MVARGSRLGYKVKIRLKVKVSAKVMVRIKFRLMPEHRPLISDLPDRHLFHLGSDLPSLSAQEDRNCVYKRLHKDRRPLHGQNQSDT